MNPPNAMTAQAYQYAYANAYNPAQPAAQPAQQLPPAYRSLMVVGLLGWVYKRREDAAVACDVAEQLLQDPLQFRIHRALAQAMGGDSQYAAETLNKYLDQHPADDAAKVLLGVSLMLGGDAGWKPILESVLASSADQNARQAAMQAVGHLRSMG